MLSILQAIFAVIGVIVTIIGIVIILAFHDARRFKKELEEDAKEIAKMNAEMMKKRNNAKRQIVYINNLGKNKRES